MKNLALALVVASFFSAANSRADFQVDTDAVFDALDRADMVQFSGLIAGKMVTDEISSEGVTFSPFVIYNSNPFHGPNNFGNHTGTWHCEALCNPGETLPEFSIHFTRPVRDAAMMMWINDGATVELTSLLRGTVVEHVTFVNPTLDPPPFFGFLDTEIDQIVINVGDNGAVIEYLGFRLPAVDDDADGVIDDVDNCASVANADQADFDADRIGDVCDACPNDWENDWDADGVCGDVDVCPYTFLPEAPTKGLRFNRFADIDGDGTFETRRPNGVIQDGPYSMDDTAGCSCEEIVDSLELGAGHIMFGCSRDVMSHWVDLVGSD